MIGSSARDGRKARPIAVMNCTGLLLVDPTPKRHVEGADREPHAACGPARPTCYKVGSSPVWRMGKKLLGVYLPWRFRAGNPFHAGLPWKGMELGLNVMSTLLAKKAA